MKNTFPEWLQITDLSESLTDLPYSAQVSLAEEGEYVYKDFRWKVLIEVGQNCMRACVYVQLV